MATTAPWKGFMSTQIHLDSGAVLPTVQSPSSGMGWLCLLLRLGTPGGLQRPYIAKIPTQGRHLRKGRTSFLLIPLRKEGSWASTSFEVQSPRWDP